MLRLIVLMLFSAAPAFAATYYVSPNGTASWPDCSDSSTPCSATTGLANVIAGDVLQFRGGTYPVSGSSLSPTNSGTSTDQIVIQAYPGETPVLSGDSSREVLIEAYNDDYITIDGFTLQTSMDIAGPQVVLVGTGNIVRNCIFNGNTATTSTNSPAVYIPSGCTDCVVQNNHISGYQSSNGSDNVCALMFYATDGLIVENNTITNCYNGIYIKQNNQNMVVRKNFIHNITNMEGILIHSKGAADRYQDNIDIYQNVFVDIGRIVVSMETADGSTISNIDFYNNTIYDSQYGLNQPDSDASGFNFWNNIFSNITNNVLKDNNLVYSDYNQPHTTPLFCEWRCTGGDTFSYWVSEFTTFDQNSTESNPNFVNAGGTSVTDYKRSSYPTDGRGGSYEDVIGAYITGTETIGYTSSGVATITTWYQDADGDGYHATNTQSAETDPGTTWYELSELTGGGDCNDNDAAFNPGATQVCGNGLDEQTCEVIDDTCPTVSGGIVLTNGGVPLIAPDIEYVLTIPGE